VIYIEIGLLAALLILMILAYAVPWFCPDRGCCCIPKRELDVVDTEAAVSKREFDVNAEAAADAISMRSFIPRGRGGGGRKEHEALKPCNPATRGPAACARALTFVHFCALLIFGVWTRTT
jgi:hypothetical protein